ncbi:MAG TPA: phosphopantetheine-binding protein [Verrucomicrobiae bacterium]
MSVVQHIKEMISSNATENADAWAAKWFAGPQQAAASGVAQLVIAGVGGDLDRLSAETRFIEDLALNELQRVQLVMAVEQQFNVEISDEDADGIDTIAQLIEWVHTKTLEPAPIKQVAAK